MKANEIRIGNLIYFLGNDVTVKGIYIENYPQYYIEVEGSVPCKIMHFKPIPLTEKWLLKFGFKKADKSDEFGGYLSPELPNGNKIRIKDNKWNSQHLLVELESVHQLQNLYFALTNSELTLKQ